MKNEVAVVKEAVGNLPAALSMDESDLIRVLEASLYPGAQHDSIKLVVGYCRASTLDPMQKPVHIVPMKVKTGKQNQYGDDEYGFRDVIMPGVGLYRTQAARTGQLAGISEPEFGPAKILGFKRSEWVDDPEKPGKRKKVIVDAAIEYPEWCRVTVKRATTHGVIAEFTAIEYWLENYATAGRDSIAPNAMWTKRPRGQLAKCAEAQALRRGFPEMTGSAPTADEMEGKTIGEEIDITPPKAEIKMPQAAKRAGVIETPVTAKQMDAPSVSVPADDVIEGKATEKSPEPDQAPAAPRSETPPSADPLCSDGAKVFITRKLGARDPVAFAEEHGCDWNHLTVSGFNVLKKALSS